MQEALEYKVRSGGAIKKPRKKSPKRDPKIEEAIEAKIKQGGSMKKRKYHDAIHKHLMQNLTGRGGGFDSPFVREKMHQLTSSYHPSIFHSYLSGRVRNLPSDPAHAPGSRITKTRPDPRPTIVNTGGSLNAITHSENGLLQAFDSQFYSHVELV